MKVKLLNHTPSPEKLIVEAYLSCRNIYDDIKIESDDDIKKRIERIWQAKHFGCFEEAGATILASGLSRSCTHQLVRHRLFSFKQLSMRAVEPDKLDFITPPTIEHNPEAFYPYQVFLYESKRLYSKLREIGIPKEDARFCIPMGIETQIVITGNFRTWLHFLNMRTNPRAQWEIRELAWSCYVLLKEIAPNVFSIKQKENWIYV